MPAKGHFGGQAKRGIGGAENHQRRRGSRSGGLIFYPLPRRLILSDVDIIKFGTICHHGRGRFLRDDAIPIDGGGSLGSTCWDLFVVIGDVRSS